MVKSSTKKHFKKDIPILKIQRNSKYHNQHGDSNFENYYLLGPICTNKKFYIKLIFKKHRVSCHNLFLLGRRKPATFLTFQEDHNVSSLFLPKFNWQYGISKMVSLSIRKLREVNLCGFFDFGSTGPNSGN